jgi:hypothetical protein
MTIFNGSRSSKALSSNKYVALYVLHMVSRSMSLSQSVRLIETVMHLPTHVHQTAVEADAVHHIQPHQCIQCFPSISIFIPMAR